MKKYQTDKAERETGSIDNMEVVSSMELARVEGPELQYGAKAFGAHWQEKVERVDREKVLLN